MLELVIPWTRYCRDIFGFSPSERGNQITEVRRGASLPIKHHKMSILHASTSPHYPDEKEMSGNPAPNVGGRISTFLCGLSLPQSSNKPTKKQTKTCHILPPSLHFPFPVASETLSQDKKQSSLQGFTVQ